VRDRAATLEKVLEITRELARPLDLTTLLAKVVDAALQHPRRGARHRLPLRRPADVLISRVATGSGELRIPGQPRICRRVRQDTRQIVSVPDAYADPALQPRRRQGDGVQDALHPDDPLIGHDDALVGVLQVLNKRAGVFDGDDEGVATALAASCAVAIQRMRLLEDLLAKQRMERELEVARDIQTRVLPKSMPALPGYEVAGWSRAADQTGGDIFDVIAKDGSVMLLLGDATGHGIGPALSVTQVRAMLRMAVRLGAGLDDAFRHINDQLADDLSSNRFVTAFLGVLDTATHRLTYHAGGQGRSSISTRREAEASLGPRPRCRWA
jgi:phosphoserine phosphatase